MMNDEKGQALVETAFIFIFLMILVIGMAEVGIALQRQIVVVNAAREGARFGAYGAKPTDVIEQTRQATSQLFDFDEENVTIVVIEATISGSNITEWKETAYPVGISAPHMTEEMILEAGITGDVKLIIVDVEYQHEGIFNFPLLSSLAGRIPIGSWTCMRNYG